MADLLHEPLEAFSNVLGIAGDGMGADDAIPTGRLVKGQGKRPNNHSEEARLALVAEQLQIAELVRECIGSQLDGEQPLSATEAREEVMTALCAGRAAGIVDEMDDNLTIPPYSSYYASHVNDTTDSLNWQLRVLWSKRRAAIGSHRRAVRYSGIRGASKRASYWHGQVMDCERSIASLLVILAERRGSI